ncbi:MAG TPA: carboxypeptidase-like regulatory domain-containing protein [Terriglobales bacterium]|nr:carboxypeptidase-like regulatory domain-containing protein [Terriglobales bacterium]
MDQKLFGLAMQVQLKALGRDCGRAPNPLEERLQMQVGSTATGCFPAVGFALLAFLVFLATGNPARAQVLNTGGVSGMVVDQSGGVIANATVIIRDPLTGFTRTVTSNASGLYALSDLQPARYQLKVVEKGFADAVVSDVVVQAGHTVDLKIEMKVGTATEVVEVSAQSQVLETTTNTLSTTISPEAIQDLPLAGRDALQFAELVAGATSAGQERYTVMDALPAAALNITVDGANDNFQRYRSTTTGFFTAAPLRIGAFDELTVSTSSLTADAGAEGASTLKFVTKRGTNQFHGTAFWQAVNSVFNANSPLLNAEGISKPSSHLNDYGGSLGGPLWKDKIFFFVNYEWETSPSPYPDSTQVFTTGANGQANSAAGDFTYETANGGENTVNLLQIAAHNGFPSTVNSTTAGLLRQINGYLANGSVLPGQYSALSGGTQGGTNCCLMPVTNTLAWAQPFEYKLRYPTARVDYQIKPKLALHFSWDLQWFQETGAPNYPGNTLQGGSWKSTYFTTSTGLDWTITPHLMNQFTFATESTIEQFNPTTKGDPFAAQADEVINPPLSVNPVIPGFILNAPRDNPLWQFIDNVTWNRGKHTFTFGGSTRISTMYETEVNNPPTYNTGVLSTDPAFGMFTSTNFPGINTGNNNQQLAAAESLYAFLVGRISSVSGSNYVSSNTGQYQLEGRLLDREKQTVGGFYVQDAWRVSPHFALNYGFRWQLSGALYSTNNYWTSPTYANLLGPSSGLFQPGVLNGVQNPVIQLRAHPYSADLKEPAPNLGFAWNPNFAGGSLGKLFGGSNTVVRGGASLSYYDEGWATTENSFYTNPGGYQSVYLTPSVNFVPGSISLGGTIPPLVSFPSNFKTAFPLPESAFTFIPQAFDTVNPNIRSPYTIAWNVGIQRKLPGSNVLEVAYVGNHVVHSWLQYDLNEVNIFENGFLNQFQAAQKNLAANAGTSFADTGLTPTPIFDTAFAGQTNPSPYTNSSFIYDLQTGQAGALAGALASNYVYFCNLVGANSSFTPCNGSGGTGKYPINLFQVNPYATGAIAQLLSDPGSSTYNALQVQWKHPAGHGLMLGANYTYSHSLTNRWLGDYYTADEVQYNFTTLRDPGLNKGPSPYDERHQFKTYMTYALPFGANRQYRTGVRILDNIIGGWTGGAIVKASSGLPFKLLGGTNTYNYSFALPIYYPTYPDASDSGVVLNGVTLSQVRSNIGAYAGPSPSVPKVAINPQFLTAHANAIQPESTPGALGQLDYLNGPKFFDVDFSVHKEIPIYDRLHLDIRAEFLNAFNHPIWAIPGVTGGPGQPADFANVSTTNYDALGLVSTPRTIEFRMQLTF